MKDEAPLELVDASDLDRDQGTWNEIALLPKRLQDQRVAETQAEFTDQRTERMEKIAK